MNLYQQYLLQSSRTEEFLPAPNVSSRMCKFCLGFHSCSPSYSVVLTFCKSSTVTALRHGLPATVATITHWILSADDVARLSVIKEFSESTFPAHFRSNLLTSPNHRAFFGLIGHWINNAGNDKVGLLGIERFKGPHTGLNQAAVIWQVLKHYILV